MSNSNAGNCVNRSEKCASWGCDDCYIGSRTSSSTRPMDYRLKSQFANHEEVPRYSCVDIDSVLSGRDAPHSECGMRRAVSVLGSLHAPLACDPPHMKPILSRLTNAPRTYRELTIDRFRPLLEDPQSNIYWDFASNTQLEAKDSFKQVSPELFRTKGKIGVRCSGGKCRS